MNRSLYPNPCNRNVKPRRKIWVFFLTKLESVLSSISLGMGFLRFFSLTVAFLLTIHCSLSYSESIHSFLRTGPGGRTQSVGAVSLASMEEPSSVFYNASLMNYSPSGVLLEYSNLMEDASRSEASLLQRSKSLDFGLFWKRDQLPFSTYKDIFVLSTSKARVCNENLSVGISFGALQQTIAGYSGRSYFLTPSFSWIKKEDSRTYGFSMVLNQFYSSSFRLRPNGDSEKFSTVPEVSGMIKFKKLGVYGKMEPVTSINYGGGITYSPFSTFELRLGYDENIRTGVGFHWQKWKFNYCLKLAELKNAHSFNIVYSWGR